MWIVFLTLGAFVALSLPGWVSERGRLSLGARWRGALGVMFLAWGVRNFMNLDQLLSHTQGERGYLLFLAAMKVGGGLGLLVPQTSLLTAKATVLAMLVLMVAGLTQAAQAFTATEGPGAIVKMVPFLLLSGARGLVALVTYLLCVREPRA